MNAISGLDIGKEIGELFPGRAITRLQMNVAMDEAVSVTITELVDEKQAKGLIEVVRKYHLEEQKP